jgi:hypothetical protein
VELEQRMALLATLEALLLVARQLAAVLAAE